MAAKRRALQNAGPAILRAGALAHAVKQPVVVVLGQAEIVADPEPQAQQQAQLVLVARRLRDEAERGDLVALAYRARGPAEAQLDARVRPAKRSYQVGLFDKQLRQRVAHSRVPRCFDAERTDVGLRLRIAAQLEK